MAAAAELLVNVTDGALLERVSDDAATFWRLRLLAAVLLCANREVPAAEALDREKMMVGGLLWKDPRLTRERKEPLLWAHL